MPLKKYLDPYKYHWFKDNQTLKYCEANVIFMLFFIFIKIKMNLLF